MSTDMSPRNFELRSSEKDLAQFCRGVKIAAGERPIRDHQDGASGSGGSLLEAKGIRRLLTSPIEHQTTAQATQETIMADENDTTSKIDAPASVAAPDAPKKQRKPRVKKAAPEAAPADVAVEPVTASSPASAKRGKPRGRKPKSDVAASIAKSTPVRQPRKSTKTAPTAPPSAIDEMADLLQLEEENQKLRKQLSEKLRAENADLRKRLNLG